jgi:hypothetical protein
MTFNVTAMILAIAGVWDYPRRYTGAMVLGNLYTAILIRNELFGRFLYLLVNTLFAKARLTLTVLHILKSYVILVAPSRSQAGVDFGPTTPWRHSLRMCDFWLPLAHLSRRYDPGPPQVES